MAVLTLDVRGPACSLLSHAHKRINVASQCCFYHVLRHSIPTGVDEVVLKTVREFWEWNNFLVSHTRRSVCVRPLPSFLSFNRSVSLTHVGDRDEAVMSLAVPRHSIWLWPIGSTLNIGLNYKCQRFEFCWRCKKKTKKTTTNKSRGFTVSWQGWSSWWCNMDIVKSLFCFGLRDEISQFSWNLFIY